MKGEIIKGSLPNGVHIGVAGGWKCCIPNQQNPACTIRMSLGVKTP